MPHLRGQSNSAFSLIELMVAVAIAVIVGGAIITSLLHAFDAWESIGGKTGALGAIDDLDVAFSRDFAAAAPKLGFYGSQDGCLFWTHSPSVDGSPSLVRIKYAVTPEGTYSERWDIADDPDKDGIVTRYATCLPFGFRYGDTNATDGAWTTDWQSPSNMPVAVTIELKTQPPMPEQRVYVRRTP